MDDSSMECGAAGARRAAPDHYGIEVYGMPLTTWLTWPGDEDDADARPHLTTALQLADRYASYADAMVACRAAVRQYPRFSFRPGLID